MNLTPGGSGKLWKGLGRVEGFTTPFWVGEWTGWEVRDYRWVGNGGCCRRAGRTGRWLRAGVAGEGWGRMEQVGES